MRNEERDDVDDEVGSCDRGREDETPRRGGDSDTQIEAEFGLRRLALGTGNAVAIPRWSWEAEIEVGEVEAKATGEGKAAAAGERLLTSFLDDELLVIVSHAEEGEVVLVGRQAQRTTEMKAPLLLLLLLLMPHPAVVYRRAAPRSLVRAELAVVRWTCVSGE